MTDKLIKELRAYPAHYEAAHKAADALEKAAKDLAAFRYHSDVLHDVEAALSDHIAQQQLDIVTLSGQIERLSGAMQNIINDDFPRVVAASWRKDGVLSKNDECPHWRRMYEDCSLCVADYARATLAEQEKK